MRALKDIFDELENKRREAYVRAVMRAAEAGDVVGYIGFSIPVALFHAIGLMALPVYGIDGNILEFSVEHGLCSVVDATLTYAKTDRCPLIHSSSMIVVDNSCPIMAHEMSRITWKQIYIYNNSEAGAEKRLASKLKEVYGRAIEDGAMKAARSDLDKCRDLLHRLKFYSDLNGLQVYIMEYYLNFLPLNERLSVLREISAGTVFTEAPVDFIPVRVQSGAGIYRQIDRIMAGRSYRIMEEGCRAGVARCDFAYEACPFAEGTGIRYDILREGN